MHNMTPLGRLGRKTSTQNQTVYVTHFFFLPKFGFYMHLFHKIQVGKANSVDPDQSAPSGSALFAYAILSDK